MIKIIKCRLDIKCPKGIKVWGYADSECYNEDCDLKENSNVAKPDSRYNVLADGCVAMDKERYLSWVSDMSQYWTEFPSEKIAMKWMAIKIYNEFIVAEKKATVS